MSNHENFFIDSPRIEDVGRKEKEEAQLEALKAKVKKLSLAIEDAKDKRIATLEAALRKIAEHPKAKKLTQFEDLNTFIRGEHCAWKEAAAIANAALSEKEGE